MGIKTHELLTFDLSKHHAWLVWCPACEAPHSFDERWGFDGDHEAPTFTGSMLVHEVLLGTSEIVVTFGHPRCHSHLIAGIWNYCSDCTHVLKDQKVPAPDWSTTRFGRMRPDGVVPHEEDVCPKS